MNVDPLYSSSSSFQQTYLNKNDDKSSQNAPVFLFWSLLLDKIYINLCLVTDLQLRCSSWCVKIQKYSNNYLNSKRSTPFDGFCSTKVLINSQ